MERALLQAAEYADKAAALDATVPQIHFVHRDEAAWKVEELLALSPEFSLSRLLRPLEMETDKILPGPSLSPLSKSKTGNSSAG